MGMKNLSVTAGLIVNARGEYLLAQRPRGKAHEGLWEFPGGKIEAGEDAASALARELKEELDLELVSSEPHGVYTHVDEKQQLVLTLTVLRVSEWLGNPIGLEGQAHRWVSPARIHRLQMLSADRPIALELGLPDTLLITPEPPAPGSSAARRIWLSALERSLAQGHKLVLLRIKQSPLLAQHAIAALARDLAKQHGAEIMLQDDAELCERWRFGGVSLTLKALSQKSPGRNKKRTLPPELWLSASCHSEAELSLASTLGCDFATLSPVLPTSSHPGAPTLGWPRVAEYLSAQTMPVFALGGLVEADLAAAKAVGAWGIAGISAFWAAE